MALTILGLVAGGTAQAQEAKQPPTEVPAHTTAQGMTQTRVHAEQQIDKCNDVREDVTQDVQKGQKAPDTAKDQLVQTGCAPSDQQMKQVQKENQEMDEIYNRLMKESDEDAKLVAKP